MVKEIALTQGKVALVDDDDYDWLEGWKWCAHYDKDIDRWVAVRGEGVAKHHRIIYMHRQIMDAERGQQVDHVNHDPLDNRRSNLRICSQSENQRNRRALRNNKSGYKGVRWVGPMHSWRAQIRVNGTTIHLGYHADPLSAARAYDEAAKTYFGEFACLNEIEGQR